MTLEILVYPNPTSDVVRVKIPTMTSPVILEIWDLTGKRILRKNSESIMNLETINVSNWQNGIYLIRIETAEGRRYMTKFVKE